MRMAEALGCGVVMTILPRHIHLSVCLPDKSDSYTYITATRTLPISFDINTRLSELSWALADGKINFEEAKVQFDSIIRTPPADKNLVSFSPHWPMPPSAVFSPATGLRWLWCFSQPLQAII